MPINLNTGSGVYSINASRIEKFLQAQSRDQALHMGAWDKFKDLFRAGDDKKAVQIAKIYDSIVKPEAHHASSVGMADRFKRLRDMASDESKQQFSIQSEKDATPGFWSFSFSIGNEQIFERKNLLDTHFESYESFSNYQKYFDGIDTVPAAPEAIKDLGSSLSGVLHEMAGPQSGQTPVLQALAKVRDFLRTPVTTQDPGEQRDILASNGYESQHIDDFLERSKEDPVGFRLLLAYKREEDLKGEIFLAPLATAIEERVNELPRQQLLAIADFYRANPYFADGLRQAGTTTLMTWVSNSSEDRDIGFEMAKAALIDDLGKTSKLVFEAVQRSLDGDIYRSYATSDTSWKVDPNDSPFPSEDLSKVIENFVGGKQDLASTIETTAPTKAEPAQPSEQGHLPPMPPQPPEPWAMKV